MTIRFSVENKPMQDCFHPLKDNYSHPIHLHNLPFLITFPTLSLLKHSKQGYAYATLLPLHLFTLLTIFIRLIINIASHSPRHLLPLPPSSHQQLIHGNLYIPRYDLYDNYLVYIFIQKLMNFTFACRMNH